MPSRRFRPKPPSCCNNEKTGSSASPAESAISPTRSRSSMSKASSAMTASSSTSPSAFPAKRRSWLLPSANTSARCMTSASATSFCNCESVLGIPPFRDIRPPIQKESLLISCFENQPTLFCYGLLKPGLRAESRQALDRVCANRAGIRADDRQRGIAHEEGVALEVF